MAGSPIFINLSTTDMTDDATWLYKDGGSAHGDDSYFTPTATIANPIISIIPLFADSFAGVDFPRTNEQESQGFKPSFSGGGKFIRRVEDPLLNTAINQKTAIDVKPLATYFTTNARANGGLTMSLILQAKNDLTLNNPEAKYIAGAGSEDVFDSTEFYRNSAYISFHSRERLTDPSIAPVINYLNIVSLRKNFRYNYISIPLENVAGMLVTSVNGASSTITLSNLSWGDIAGLSANARVTFQGTIISPSNETITGNVIGVAAPNTPTSVSCASKTQVFVGFNGSDATFTNINGRSLFSGVGGYEHNGYVAIADPNYGFESGTQRYQAPIKQPVPFLRIRNANAFNAGNRNLIELNVSGENTVRFFGTTPGMTASLGIEVGSYIELSGLTIPSNNGIYQVIARYDGVPGEENNFLTIPSSGATVPRYQYLELSRNITAESNPTGSIRVRNVSKLPILHIKYEYTP